MTIWRMPFCSADLVVWGKRLVLEFWQKSLTALIEQLISNLATNATLAKLLAGGWCRRFEIQLLVPVYPESQDELQNLQTQARLRRKQPHEVRSRVVPHQRSAQR